jgi:hypothetical protein
VCFEPGGGNEKKKPCFGGFVVACAVRRLLERWFPAKTNHNISRQNSTV